MAPAPTTEHDNTWNMAGTSRSTEPAVLQYTPAAHLERHPLQLRHTNLLSSVEAIRASASRIPREASSRASGTSVFASLHRLERSGSGIPTPMTARSACKPERQHQQELSTANFRPEPGTWDTDKQMPCAVGLVASTPPASTTNKLPPRAAVSPMSPYDWSISALHAGSQEAAHSPHHAEQQQESLTDISISPLLQLRISPMLDREEATDAIDSLGRLSLRMAALRDRLAWDSTGGQAADA